MILDSLSNVNKELLKFMEWKQKSEEGDGIGVGNASKRTRHCEGRSPVAIPWIFRLSGWCGLLFTGLPRACGPRNDVLIFKRSFHDGEGTECKIRFRMLFLWKDFKEKSPCG